MAAKDDASTDIEALVKRFASDMTAECAKIREKRLKGIKQQEDEAQACFNEPPEITFALDPDKASKCRTPAEQAQQVVANRSWVCWAAHMADKARHVLMKADGKITWNPKKVMGEDFNVFKTAWGTVMKKYGLKNYKGGDGWADGDEFHLELADSKIAKTDDRVQACFEEYARLSRKEKKGKNDKFEKQYATDLKSYLSKYPEN